MAEDNDFDEWLDDVETDDDGELDQLNIDALLSAVDEQPAAEDSNSGDATTSELDQTNIDALLGINNASPDTPEADDDDLDELDQDNIDALLNGSDSDTAPKTVENEPEELGQDNIDTLLNGDDDGELDQDNIDALLSADDIDTSELDQNDLDALPSADELDTSELDQNNIDDLLSADDIDTSELDQNDLDALPSADDIDTSELDQDNIDALLSADDDLDTSELDQDNIDALLGSDDDSPTESVNEAIDQDNIDALLAEDNTDDDALGDDLAQDDIDDLFAESPSTDETPEMGDDPSEDDIDALFNDIDAATSGESDGDATGDEQSVDELFAEETSGDETALSSEDANAIADTAFDSEFDEMDQLFSELEDENPDDDDPFQAEEIDFAEMLDTSDGDGGEDEFLSLGEDDEEEFAGLEQEAEPDQDGNETNIDALLMEGNGGEGKEDDAQKGLVIAAMLADMSKTTLSAIGGTLVLLLIVGIFIFSGGDDANDSTASLQMTNMEEHVSPATTPEDNFIPIVEDSMFTMADDGGELPIELQANDEDGQTVNFEITRPPSYGRLSGEAPNFTYLANSNFPGEDSFEYTASDGKDTSMAAMITITGPDLKGQALAEKIAEESRKQKIIAKEIKPKQPVVHAKNVHFYTDSTAPVTISWRRIWQEANKSDYDPKVHVEIIKAETAGSLKTSGSKTTFTPDPYSGQTDLIFYRFKKNGFRSATKTISIDIALGNPAPEINLVELKDGYPVGHNVNLDASPSRDNAPQSLHFSWKQIAGTPVSMQISPENGTHMSFVMPSSFYNKKNSGPVFRLTATDQTGQSTSKEITTRTISRRQAALWRGNNGGVEEDPALKGKYFPWPYDD